METAHAMNLMNERYLLDSFGREPRVSVETATRTLAEIRSVQPYRGSRDRHIHLLRKNGPTPKELPRRPGMAAKRPFGSEPN